MMLRFASLLVAVCVLLAYRAVASTNCEQKIAILGKTSGDTCQLWFSEQLTGECERFDLKLLLLTPTGATDFSREYTAKEVGIVQGLIAGLGEEIGLDLVDTEGVFRLGKQAMFNLPGYDSSFQTRFRSIADGSLENWNRRCVADCAEYPAFFGATATLVYRHPRGLYKNYKVKSAIYYEHSGWLVLVTDQPMMADGGDSMHGLLVFRIALNTSPSSQSSEVQLLPDKFALERKRWIPDSVKCDQNFYLFDKTRGVSSLTFFRMDWNGRGCDRGMFYTAFLLSDRVHIMPSQFLQGNWVSSLFSNMEIEPYQTITEADGRFVLNDSVYFQLPTPDSMFESKFRELAQPDARNWRATWQNYDTTYPIFTGSCPEKLFELADGLYRNYTISEARYYRESNYLILLTRHPLRDVRGNTMHGLLIYKVDGWKWLETPPCEYVD